MSKLISIIAPCFNEKDNIQAFYDKIKNIFNNKLSGYEYEIIVVDDYSEDGSVEILEKIAEKDRNFKVILIQKVWCSYINF